MAVNYMENGTRSEPAAIQTFQKAPSAIIGPGDSMVLPDVPGTIFEGEAELAVVIGKTATNVPQSEAMDYVFGYTCGHDVSARDWQKGRPGGQWLLGKTFDTFAPTGPCMVTRSEVADPSNLSIRMHLNGQTVQDSTTAQLIFDIPSLPEHLTKIVKGF